MKRFLLPAISQRIPCWQPQQFVQPMGMADVLAGTAGADNGKINLITQTSKQGNNPSDQLGISAPKKRKSGWYWQTAIPR